MLLLKRLEIAVFSSSYFDVGKAFQLFVIHGESNLVENQPKREGWNRSHLPSFQSHKGWGKNTLNIHHKIF